MTSIRLAASVLALGLIGSPAPGQILPGVSFLACVKSVVDKSVAADGVIPNVLDERFARRKATYLREITTLCAKFIDLKKVAATLYDGDESKAAAYADGLFDSAAFSITLAIFGSK
jgi:hypothetical protein